MLGTALGSKIQLLTKAELVHVGTGEGRRKLNTHKKTEQYSRQRQRKAKGDIWGFNEKTHGSHGKGRKTPIEGKQMLKS